MSADEAKKVPDLSNIAVTALTVVAAFSVATSYYIQPIIQEVGREFQLSHSGASLMAALFQVGLAVGLVTALPLADSLSARKVLLVIIPLQIVALVGIALSPNIWVFVTSALAAGLFGVTPYILPPYASLRSSRQRLGFVTGMLTGGVASGILFARVLSGFLATWLNWRAVFFLAAITMIVSLICISKLVIHQPRRDRDAYRELLRSMVDMIRSQRKLRVAAYIQALSFGSFSIFWLGSAFFLQGKFNWTPEKVGGVGLLGALSIFCAPVIGRIAQVVGLERVRTIATFGTLLSWSLLYFLQENLVALAATTIVLSICAVATDICCRTILYSLSADIRTRLNAIYTMAMFACGAISSALVGTTWEFGGWAAICGLAGTQAVVALLISLS